MGAKWGPNGGQMSFFGTTCQKMVTSDIDSVNILSLCYNYQNHGHAPFSEFENNNF